MVPKSGIRLTLSFLINFSISIKKTALVPIHYIFFKLPPMLVIIAVSPNNTHKNEHLLEP